MNTTTKLSHLLLFYLLLGSSCAFAQAGKEASELADTLLRMQERGASNVQIAQAAKDYWIRRFNELSVLIKVSPAKSDELERLQARYDQRTMPFPPPNSELMKNLHDEAKSSGTLTSVGQISGDNKGVLRSLQGAFGISVAASHGRMLPELLSVLSKQKHPTSLDLLVYRIFTEESGIGDNSFKLTDEQRRYTTTDFERLAQLANHPNPVARLIAIEMLDYVANAKEDATPALAAMMHGLRSEENPAVIKRVVERANRQRSKVYKDVLPELSKRVEGSNPSLKDEAQRVIKAIEETTVTP